MDDFDDVWFFSMPELFWIAMSNFIIRQIKINAVLYTYLYLHMETGMFIAFLYVHVLNVY